jgi:hypothetical protein
MLRIKIALVLFAVTITAQPSVWAQRSARTHVAVVVNDPDGAVIARAKVRFTKGPNSVAETTTDDLGQLMVDLGPGSYTLSIASPGFARYTRVVEVVAVKEEQILSAVLQVLDLGGEMVSGVGPEELELQHEHHAPLKLRLPDLKAMPHVKVTVHNPHTNADETYSGVRLAGLLLKIGAPLGKDLHGEALANYVVATGSDGYKAVLALGEIDPSFHPGEILVADSIDSKPLDAHSGPFKLVVSEDKRPARCVRNLTTIELKSAQ